MRAALVQRRGLRNDVLVVLRLTAQHDDGRLAVARPCRPTASCRRRPRGPLRTATTIRRAPPASPACARGLPRAPTSRRPSRPQRRRPVTGADVDVMAERCTQHEPRHEHHHAAEHDEERGATVTDEQLQERDHESGRTRRRQQRSERRCSAQCAADPAGSRRCTRPGQSSST